MRCTMARDGTLPARARGRKLDGQAAARSVSLARGDPSRPEGTPMSSRRLLRMLLGPAVAAALAAMPAAATTIVPLSDAALVAKSPLVVVARVEGTLPSSQPGPYTDWLVTVQRVLKGELSDGAIVVRVLGGDTADGDRLTLHGAPRFAEREQVLLFLAPRLDGTWGIAQFLQGAFHAVPAGAKTAAVRDLSEVKVIGGGRRRGGRDRATAPRLREFAAFADWIEDRAAGLSPARDYFFRPTQGQMGAIIGRFTLFEQDGLNLRWFEFDSGGSVTWRAHESGQNGLAGGGFQEHQRALGVWTAEATTPIKLVYGGTTSVSAGFQRYDRNNVLLFNDPNQDIEGTFDCAEGGTLAIGGPWSDPSVTARFNGRPFIKILAADVVMNDGIECSIERSGNPSKFMEEVYAHELGHTLGLGHSSENETETNRTLRDALMFFQAHNDGRGGRLNSDDVAGLQALYKRSGGGGGGGGSCPAGTLCMLNGRFRVTATWQNQFDGSSGAAGTQRASDLSGYLYFTDPANTELIVKILDFGSVIKVFYGQLTNLHFTIRVEDTRTGTVKTYSNTPGDCGAFDNNGFPSNAVMAIFARSSRRGRRPTTAGSCRADSDTMCLLNSRFAVEMTWRNQYDGTSGTGIPKRLSELTGAFAFTDPSNLEILIKTLDFGDRILVLYGALSNLEYTLKVTDTRTGAVKTYFNPANQYCGGLDNNAF
ncbi:MAG: matrixin family metalloprotease [Thermoanaerobaculia bacterium]|nr:MAG: matrixin family metalloprotease [Thermoanaerobaculia bacterium]